MARNPIQWNNVRSNVTSNTTGALNLLQKSTNSVKSTLKDIYDKSLENNTIDAITQIRNGQQVSVSGPVDRKALLSFSIENEKLRNKQKYDELKYMREAQIYNQSERTNPYLLQKTILNTEKQAQELDYNDKANPLNLQKLELDNASKEQKNNYDGSTHGLRYDLLKQSVDSSSLGLDKKQQEQDINDITFGSRKAIAKNAKKDVDVKLQLEQLLNDTQQIESDYANGKISDKEAFDLRNIIKSKQNELSSKLLNGSKADSYSKYGFTSKDVEFTKDGLVKAKKGQMLTAGQLNYNKDVMSTSRKLNGSSKSSKKVRADAIDGYTKNLYVNGATREVPLSYKEQEKYLLDNKKILTKQEFLDKQIADMRSKDVVTTNPFQPQWYMKNGIERNLREGIDKTYTNYVKQSFANDKDAVKTKRKQIKLSIPEILKAQNLTDTEDIGVALKAIYDASTQSSKSKLSELKDKESQIKDKTKQEMKIRKQLKKYFDNDGTNDEDKQTIQDIIKGIM